TRPKVPESRLRSMTAEQAAHAVAALPRQVVLRLFPWPPPPCPLAPAAAAQTQQQAPQAPAAAAAAAASEHASEPTSGSPAAAQAAASGAAAAAPTTADSAAADVASASGAAWWPSVHVRAVRQPILLAGRYCKLRRHMPQSPWFDMSTGARIGGSVSVQEVLQEWLLPLYGCAGAKMVTGGREDADVRMLGAGRPFVLELQAPLRGHPPSDTFRRLEQRMLESKCGVSAQGLSPCGRSALDAIKAAEEVKEKTYRALCWAAPAPSPQQLAGLLAAGRVEAQQDTPVRVLHRRAAKVRPKWLRVEAAEAVAGKPGYFVITLRTQAGAYVKEFCHGDFGRCRPSLGDLLAQLAREEQQQQPQVQQQQTAGGAAEAEAG
ncbi:hypothetical protein Agub_g8541, partial [Astrephomene gubernaculifera]